MAEAIVLRLDAAGDAAVRSVWDRLGAAGVPSVRSLTHGRHHPHVSLVVAERVRRGDWVDLVRERFLAGGAMRLELGAPAVFPGPGGWLFLAVTMTPRLLDAHAAVAQAVEPYADGVWEHYRPGVWVPHCTLAGGVDGDLVERALEAVLGAQPIVAAVADVALVNSETGDLEVVAAAP